MFWPSNLLGQNISSLRQGQGKLAADSLQQAEKS
jgi:hypothetical protein